MPSPKLVFLSGWGFKAKLWQSIIQQFPSASVADFTANPATLLTAETILIAWSFGGLIAIDWCKRFNCQKLILVASTPKFLQTTNWPGITPLQAQRFTRQLASNFKRGMQRFQQVVSFPEATILPGLIETTLSNSPLLKQQLTDLWQLDYRKTYAALRLPILHIFGAQDAIVPLSVTERLSHPSLKLSVIPKAGHALFLTHPMLFLSLLTAFIYA